MAVLGIGGMGKTTLVTKLAEQVGDHFDYLLWRSLRNAPRLEENLSEGISRIIDYLRKL